MSEPFLAEVRIVGFNFPPRGWAECNGQNLPINQNQALYSLIGTTYGGDGTTTFALPDLRSRVPMHVGSGPGLTPRQQGQHGGVEAVTLTQAQMPAHSHTVTVTAGTADEYRVDSEAGIASDINHELFSAPSGAQVTGNSALANAGASASHPNIQPSIALNFVIALTGVFPSRN